jgi:hypothetical protein
MSDEQRLEKLLAQRLTHQREIEEAGAALQDINERIRSILKRLHVRSLQTRLGKVMVVRNRSYVWDEDKVLRWYKKHDLALPVRKVFDPAKIEKDVQSGYVEQELLEEWTDIKKGKPYVKVIQVKK